jgi:hypothetical protein
MEEPRTDDARRQRTNFLREVSNAGDAAPPQEGYESTKNAQSKAESSLARSPMVLVMRLAIPITDHDLVAQPAGCITPLCLANP